MDDVRGVNYMLIEYNKQRGHGNQLLRLYLQSAIDAYIARGERLGDVNEYYKAIDVLGVNYYLAHNHYNYEILCALAGVGVYDLAIPDDYYRENEGPEGVWCYDTKVVRDPTIRPNPNNECYDRIYGGFLSLKRILALAAENIYKQLNS